MNSIFDKDAWEKYLHGYTIYDCAIFRQHGFCLVLVEEKDDRDILPRTRFLTVIYDKPIVVGGLPLVEVGDFTFTSIARGVNPPEYVAVDFARNVYSANQYQKDTETPMSDLMDMMTCAGETSVIQNVVSVAGQVYALGTYRKIYRRLGINQWIDLTAEGKGAPMPADVSQGKHYSFMDIGFCDMSGFSQDDMYAVGGSGDVWHFNGTKWVQCHFPINELLQTVCCAGDGYVYITENHGSVWRGREDRWQKIAKADIASGYAPVDSVWFNNRLYLGAQEGIWVLDEKNNLVMLNEIEEGAPNMTNSGRLDVSPDGKFMLTAGPHGVCIHDGEKWTRLFSSFDFLRDFSFLDPNFKQ